MAVSHVDPRVDHDIEIVLPSAEAATEKRKKSIIWTFFSICETDNTKAICGTCQEKMSRGGKSSKSFNTTNLRKHMELHPKEFKEFSSMEVEKGKRERKGKATSYCGRFV